MKLFCCLFGPTLHSFIWKIIYSNFNGNNKIYQQTRRKKKEKKTERKRKKRRKTPDVPATGTTLYDGNLLK